MYKDWCTSSLSSQKHFDTERTLEGCSHDRLSGAPDKKSSVSRRRLLMKRSSCRPYHHPYKDTKPKPRCRRLFPVSAGGEGSKHTAGATQLPMTMRWSPVRNTINQRGGGFG